MPASAAMLPMQGLWERCLAANASAKEVRGHHGGVQGAISTPEICRSAGELCQTVQPPRAAHEAQAASESAGPGDTVPTRVRARLASLRVFEAAWEQLDVASTPDGVQDIRAARRARWETVREVKAE